MTSFGSLGDFAFHLLEREVAIRSALATGLDRVLARIEHTAEAEFGHYQPAVGPHPAWPELADSTKDRRVSAGFTENDPLLASGEMQKSIERQRVGLEGVVGSKDPKLAFHEFGTPTMPARPVLGPAAFRNKELIQKLVGAAVVSGLIGRDVVHHQLGYQFETKDSV